MPRFEFGLVDYDSKLDEYKLWPLDIDDYKNRQKKLRLLISLFLMLYLNDRKINTIHESLEIKPFLKKATTFFRFYNFSLKVSFRFEGF